MLAQALASEPVTRARVIASARERLPPALRPLIARLNDVLQQVRRAGAHLDITAVDPDDLTAAEREQLLTRHQRPRSRSGRLGHQRPGEHHNALTLERGGRSETLTFPAVDAFENLEFRLAFAAALALGPDAALPSRRMRACRRPRRGEFQQKGLSAPVGTDVYSLAREVLKNNDFRVTRT
ncbi:MAG: hypothetical protein U1E76_03540 [Planctomycetota bacterium]